MIIAKVTSKGQITIPKEIREKLGVRPGESIGFEEADGRLCISKVLICSPFEKWAGFLQHLTGQTGDSLVREARGHDHSR